MDGTWTFLELLFEENVEEREKTREIFTLC